MLVQSAIGATQGHLCLLHRPLVRCVMRGAMRVRAARLEVDLEMGRALGLQWDLVRRRVQSVMLHAMRLRLCHNRRHLLNQHRHGLVLGGWRLQGQGLRQ